MASASGSVSMSDPKVSVLMSVCNGERYLREAIESILNQTFQDFECIIIDDGSADSTNEIIRTYSDPRIRLVENQKNMGLTKSLNRGIDLCKGEYISRMDGDDISLPLRLEKQVDFMKKHHQTGVVGTRASEIDHEGKITIRKTAHNTYDREMKVQLMFGTCFLHPSVMIRKKILRETGLSYDKSFSTSQDYFLWWQLSLLTKFANLPECLLHYRKHSSRLSNHSSTDQTLNASRVRRLVVETLLSRDLTDKEFVFHDMLMTKPHCRSINELEVASDWFIYLVNKNEQNEVFDNIRFRRAIGTTWLSLCQNSTQLGYELLRKYSKSVLSTYSRLSLDKYLKLLSKTMLKYDPRQFQSD